MEATTENSTWAEVVLHPAKIPAPDVAFFRSFGPEIAFATLAGLFIAAMAYVFSALLWAASEKPKAEVSAPDRRLSPIDAALGKIDGLDETSEDFAQGVWNVVRSHLSTELKEPAFHNFTVSEAVSAVGRRTGKVRSDSFASVAEAALRLEYGRKPSTGDQLLEENRKLRSDAKHFLTESAWENSSR